MDRADFNTYKKNKIKLKKTLDYGNVLQRNEQPMHRALYTSTHSPWRRLYIKLTDLILKNHSTIPPTLTFHSKLKILEFASSSKLKKGIEH